MQELDDFIGDLEQMGDHFGTDLSDPLQDCRTIILVGIKENFAGSKSSTGFPWPKRKDNKPHPLLILTGELEEAATGGNGAINRVIDGITLDVGVDASSGQSGRPWAELHQEGGVKCPARSFMGFSEEVLVGCEDVLTEYAITEFVR
jgi:phage gpG-like protein